MPVDKANCEAVKHEASGNIKRENPRICIAEICCTLVEVATNTLVTWFKTSVNNEKAPFVAFASVCMMNLSADTNRSKKF